jgi:hypothetical protein
MPEEILDLDKANEVFKIKVAGETREFDVFETVAKLKDVAAAGIQTDDESLDKVRIAFGFPVKGDGATISGVVCLKLVASFFKFVEGLNVLGELQALTQKYSASIPASVPENSSDSPEPTGQGS